MGKRRKKPIGQRLKDQSAQISKRVSSNAHLLSSMSPHLSPRISANMISNKYLWVFLSNIRTLNKPNQILIILPLLKRICPQILIMGLVCREVWAC